MKITDLPKYERPREKLIAKGAANLKNRELLAILFRTGREGKNVLELSDDLLKKFTIEKLLDINYLDLIAIKGIDSGKASTLVAAFELARRAIGNYNQGLPLVQSAQDVLDQLSELRTYKKEYFTVLYLNTRNHLIHKEVISVGTVNASIVHPREVFEPAIKHIAVQIILAHNHPSGDPDPSDADIKITHRLVEAGKLIGIDVLDHIILTEQNYFSFKEEGLLA